MLQDFPNLRKENSSNSDVQNLTLKINNLIKDNQILLKDNDTLFRKYENLKEVRRYCDIDVQFKWKKHRHLSQRNPKYFRYLSIPIFRRCFKQYNARKEES